MMETLRESTPNSKPRNACPSSFLLGPSGTGDDCAAVPLLLLFRHGAPRFNTYPTLNPKFIEVWGGSMAYKVI